MQPIFNLSFSFECVHEDNKEEVVTLSTTSRDVCNFL